MTYRMTVVLEYEHDRDAPAVGPKTRDFGKFTVAAIQFSDALRELEVLHENATEADQLRAYHAATGHKADCAIYRVRGLCDCGETARKLFVGSAPTPA